VPVAHAYTQEAEIRTIVVQNQQWQIARETISRKNLSQKQRAGVVPQGIGPEFKPKY
jgi:hypothetical protein